MNAAGAAAIDVALAVHLHPVRRARTQARRLGPDAAVGERSAGLHVEHADVLALRVVDIELPLVTGEAQAVGLAEIRGESGQSAAIWLDAVDTPEIELERARLAVVLGAAVGGIGEIDPPI